MAQNVELAKALPVPGINVEANVYIKMHDGVKLAVDVYLPLMGD